MKQHISKKQWDELSKINKIEFVNAIDAQVPKGEELGVTWTFKRDFRPNIGQMIEFLDEKLKDEYLQINTMGNEWQVEVQLVIGEKITREEFCDSLWGATKEVLEK